MPTPDQHGFLKKIPHHTNLLRFLDEAAGRIEDDGAVEVGYFDISESFVPVSHRFQLLSSWQATEVGEFLTVGHFSDSERIGLAQGR